MKKNFMQRLTGLCKSILVILFLFLATRSEKVLAQPSFVNGSTQSITVCQDSGPNDITSFLSMDDLTSGSTEDWTIISSTSGTLGGFPYSDLSTGFVVTPIGLSYTPPPGFSGTDVFSIRVFDGAISDITTITVTVTALPVVAAITGADSVCAGFSTALSCPTTGGVWSTSDAGIANITSTTATSSDIAGISVGNAIITYSKSNSCGTTNVTHPLYVNDVPVVGSITGTSSICVASMVTLTDATSGGVWSSDATSVASVNASTGVVNGVAAGNAHIIYSVTNSCGTDVDTALITVNPTPSITPGSTPSAVVGAASTSLAYSTSGSPTNYDIVWDAAAITAGFTNVTGLALSGSPLSVSLSATAGAGTYNADIIVSDGTCSSPAAPFQVMLTPSSNVAPVFTGGAVQTMEVCQDAIATDINSLMRIDDADAGQTETWTIVSNPPNGALSGFPGVEISTGGVLASTGLLYTPNPGFVGLDSFTVQISDGTDSSTTQVVVTVIPLPDAGVITGATEVCEGISVTFTSSVAGGTWNTSDGGIALIDASGVVIGVTTGSAIISYTVNNSCGTATDTMMITVGPAPHAGTIDGPSLVCAGSSITLTNATTGGVWSTAGAAATVIDGVVTGNLLGTAEILYLVTNSCGSDTARHNVTIDSIPDAGVSTGLAVVCEGTSITLTNAFAGGTWSSDVPDLTVIGGVVTGVTAGSGNVIYTVTNTCGSDTAVNTITINPAPHAGTISGLSLVCVGSSVTLTNAASGGVWSVSNAMASVSDGVVTGVATGIDTILYTVTNSCGSEVAMHTVTVDTIPDVAIIGGLADVCVAASITLTNTIAGGVWSALNSNATVNAGSGLVTGAIAGTNTIVYIVTNTCGADTATHDITIHPLPAAITGSNTVAAGSLLTLSDAVADGIWSSSDPTVATITTDGVVAGVMPGTTTISYNTGCGSPATLLVFVTGGLSGVTGPGNATACDGSTAIFSVVFDDPFILFDSQFWSFSTDGGTIFTPIMGDDATYSGTGSFNLTVHATASMNGYIYHFTGDGNVSGNAILTIASTPDAGDIFGLTTVCAGASITLTDTVSGGAWSAVNANASVAGGLVTGITAGTDTILYVVTNLCGADTAMHIVTIIAAPDAGTISGPSTVCVGGIITLTNSTSGGSWSASNSSASVVGGVVTGNTIGMDTIIYTVTNSCGSNVAPYSITIGAGGGAGVITGSDSVCAGTSITLADGVTGGVWGSTNTAVASVDAFGVVTGGTPGAATITYIVTSACGADTATHNMIVSTLPSAGTISGADTVCLGIVTTMTSSVTGGVWSIFSDESIAVVDTFGGVTGINVGSGTISYTVTNSCGSAMAIHDIYDLGSPDPGFLTGPDSVCVGASIMFTASVPGGDWLSMFNVYNGAAPGEIVGGAPGLGVVYYAVLNSCGDASASYNVTVNPLPDTGTITGPLSVCAGATVSLADTATGGMWSSADATIASVDASGVVTGGSIGGTTTISYTASTFSCGTASAVHTITTNFPDAAGVITGADSVCAGASITLTNTVTGPGGTWSSTNAAIASVDAFGVVTGGSPGTATIKYVLLSACGADSVAHNVTVNSLPDAGTVAGSDSVCSGASITLTDIAAGGVWSSLDPSIADVDEFGIVTGGVAGTTAISYTVSSFSCGDVSAIHSVTTIPLPDAGTISGADSVCAGAQITLSNTATGGVWSSSSIGIASVTASGIVTGIAAGSVTITYTSASSCGSLFTTHDIIVNGLPDAGAIVGADSVCASASITLTNIASGGVWSSSDGSIVAVDASGVVTGGTVIGIATISYTAVTASCGTAFATHNVTNNIHPDPGVIIGADSVCAGAIVTLTNASVIGVWSSGNMAVATVDTFGAVTGVAAGTTLISFTSTTGCGSEFSTHEITVNALPDPGVIFGSDSVCVGGSITLVDAIAGGDWSSDDGALADVDAFGVITGFAAGSTVISYTVSSFSCGSMSALHNITIIPLPDAGSIAGADSVCAGAAITLTDVMAGGVWSSSDMAVAGVDVSGLVIGVTQGTATISYIVATSCGSDTAYHIVTVNPLPDAGIILGSDTVCAGTTITLIDAAAGGVWSSTSTSLASVDASGVVTGGTVGSATISYTVSTFSCGTASAVHPIITSPLPDAGAIAGADSVCAGASVSLTNIATGGLWISGDNAIAIVDGSGIVTGVSSGTTTISYVSTTACGSSSSMHDIIVNALPDAGTIFGNDTVCAGATVTLIDAALGGVWSSTNASVASVDASGVVTGGTVGSATISYTVSTFSCGTASAIHAIVTSPLPDAGTITGADSVCAGAQITLTNTATGGSWISGDNAIATVDGSGIVTGVSSGTTTISYISTTACGSSSSMHDITVNALPDAGSIAGADSVCSGAMITLTDVAVGGVWSSTDPSIASVDAVGGVTGGTAGTTIISYTVSSFGCGTVSATINVTTKPLPDAGAIVGADSVCAGAQTTLTNIATGGVWSSNDNAIATVNTFGVVTGVTTGTVTISYTSNSCGTASTMHDITVKALPDAGTIAGADSVCAGAVITLTDISIGGVWSSTNAAVASVDASGVVTGGTVGSATISYTVSTFSCGSAFALHTVTTNALPDAGAITGSDSVCAGSQITLSNIATGGVWGSSAAGVATVNTSGVVTGITSGAATISYTSVTSCGTLSSTHDITVNALPDAGLITGLNTVVSGNTITLTDLAIGGVWSSANATIASVDAGGVVTGGSVGTTIISYTVTTFSCGSATDTQAITVIANIVAGTIVGADSVCVGSVITLTNPTGTPGGVWMSTSGFVTVDAFGVVTGIATGTDTVKYTVTSGSDSVSTTHLVTVNPLPDAGTIVGLDSVCAGSVIALSDIATGGTWSSSALGIATVDGFGLVSGVAAGTVTISYTVATFSCGAVSVTHDITVNALPDAGLIAGADSVCAGAVITLSDIALGGTWSSSASGIATVDALGVVSGVATGSATISYTATTFSCGTASVTHDITVNALPDAGIITGADSVCAGSVTTLSDIAVGGVWSSSALGIATVDAFGVVSGSTAGTTTISYTTTTFSCGAVSVTHDITVNALPDAGLITGADSVCAGALTTLSDIALGGTWSSSASGVATVDAFGVVSGVATGSATISYTATTFSCGTASATHDITVNALPDAGIITGADSVCAGSVTTLSDIAVGGVWSSSASGVATVNAFGVVNGITAGSATISYTATTFSCGAVSVIHNVTVNALPDAGVITGSDSVCLGSIISLSNIAAGGVWNSTNLSIATVDAAGVVMGTGAGVVTINYTATTFSCGAASATHNVTVNALPVVSAITGTTMVCGIATVSLTTATTGGTWSSNDNTVATVDASGNVTSVGVGTAMISYTVINSSGCTGAASVLFTVSTPPVLSLISGPVAVARLSSVTLTDTASGGVWTSSDVTLAVVNSSTGVVTGVNMGTVTITYTKTSSLGCSSFVTYDLIVAGSLTSSTILPTGSATLCHGNSVNLVAVTAGGATDLSYQWFIDGVLIPGATNSNYVTDTFGHFTLMISNLAGSNILTGVTVILPPNPVINITGTNVLYTGSFSTYQWYLNGTAIPGATSSVYVESAFGDYTVVVSDGNGCTDTADVFTVTDNTGIVNVNTLDIRLYPNPATSVIQIESPVAVNATILSADGKVVIRANDVVSINVSGLASGMYMVMIYDHAGLLLKVDKFIKAE